MIWDHYWYELILQRYKTFNMFTFKTIKCGCIFKESSILEFLKQAT